MNISLFYHILFFQTRTKKITEVVVCFFFFLTEEDQKKIKRHTIFTFSFSLSVQKNFGLLLLLLRLHFLASSGVETIFGCAANAASTATESQFNVLPARYHLTKRRRKKKYMKIVKRKNSKKIKNRFFPLISNFHELLFLIVSRSLSVCFSCLLLVCFIFSSLLPLPLISCSFVLLFSSPLFCSTSSFVGMFLWFRFLTCCLETLIKVHLNLPAQLLQLLRRNWKKIRKTLHGYFF